MHKPWVNLLSLSIVLLAIDQVTKYMFYDMGRLSAMWKPIINTGAARSVPIPSAIIVIVGLGMSVRLLHIFKKGQQNTLQTVLIGLMLAGIRGNLIDRSIYEGVRDFISIVDRYPIFNIADMYLVCGVIGLIRYEYRSTPKTITGQPHTNP